MFTSTMSEGIVKGLVFPNNSQRNMPYEQLIKQVELLNHQKRVEVQERGTWAYRSEEKKTVPFFIIAGFPFINNKGAATTAAPATATAVLLLP